MANRISNHAKHPRGPRQFMRAVKRFQIAQRDLPGRRGSGYRGIRKRASLAQSQHARRQSDLAHGDGNDVV